MLFFSLSAYHHTVWVPAGDGRFQCLVCDGSKKFSANNVIGHERTQKHKRKLTTTPAPMEPLVDPSPPAASSTPSVTQNVRGMLENILDQMATPRERRDEWVDTYTGMSTWSSEFSNFDATMEDAPALQEEQFLAAKLSEYLNAPAPGAFESDDEVDERSNPDHSDGEPEPGMLLCRPHVGLTEMCSLAPERHISGRARHTVDLNNINNEWFPWPDRETCILDILRHVPRCSFSRTQNTAIHWAMQALGVQDLPSDRVMDDIDRVLQPLCGVESIRYTGKLGHIYYVNDLAAIIAQEMANPLVRPKLQFLPEDSGTSISQTWQSRRWLEELDPELTTPMIRIGTQDFYLNEPAILSNGAACIPERWFRRGEHIFARARELRPHLLDGRAGWVVNQELVEIDAFQLVSSFPFFVQIYMARRLPDPRIIHGIISSSGEISAWTKTDPVVGNPWRKKAASHRVVAFPVWFYCDDTSGNTSKKWNKHNSFLFTAAGLPRKYVHREYNIHFLATSNVAPVLEMFDGIVDQLEFGPAMLFATEGFEAFNAIIPRMARGNRLRHLLSGGYFRQNVANPTHSRTPAAPPATSPWMQHTRETLSVANWVSIHPKPKSLLDQNAFGARLLGFMEDEVEIAAGAFFL
ncbi:hypothetical protein MKEN_00195000 [Mycena kentingensis (nom. inval.)]|nr:hypothetical protein MKEN_00195000 [Mycena kentingensis (nom. inval.)]